MDEPDLAVADIAAAIGDRARAAMLFSLMDGCARTSTELSVVADVTPSTASAHLTRLKDAGLVKALAQGKHRYYGLAGPEVAGALEGLAVLAEAPRFVPRTPSRMRAARTCYDHAAGRFGVSLHDRLIALQWISAIGQRGDYEVTALGAERLGDLGLDLAEVRGKRRRFACACLDWSERRPHLGGALGAALLTRCLKKGWLTRDLDSRILSLTAHGRRSLEQRLGAALEGG